MSASPVSQIRPAVSIILPTYNRAHCLPRAVQSVLSQSYSNFELLIIDNNSTDNTKYIVDSFKDSRIRFFQINNNGVIARSRNFGISQSNAEFIAFLDSDDWWKPNKLNLSMQFSSEYDLIYHNMMLWNDNAQQLFRRSVTCCRSLSHPCFRDLLLNGNTIPTSSVVVRRSIIQTIGSFSENPSLFAAEDYDAWLRISRITNRFMLNPTPLGYLSFGCDNSSSRLNSLVHCTYILKLYQSDFDSFGLIMPPWLNKSLLINNFYLHNYNQVLQYACTVFRSSIKIYPSFRSYVYLQFRALLLSLLSIPLALFQSLNLWLSNASNSKY